MCSDLEFSPLSLSSSMTSRNAMDNASKNAGDMINNLQLKYNRGRQAAITNELVDIITGAYHRSLQQSLHQRLIQLSRCQCALSTGMVGGAVDVEYLDAGFHMSSSYHPLQ